MPSAAYDTVAYDASAHTHTHPTRLATMAYLLGMTPPSLYTARILEVGCATGTNLLAMAEGYPDARFVGIDYSAKQIEVGRARVAASGLTNLELVCRSIGDITEADGKFDYIIAHGVYSWIPKDMQHALLRTCSRNLSDNGVAYVSYNTLPGWSMSGIVRDIMLFHTRNLPDEQKIPAARGILDFLSKSSPADTPYGQVLRETSARLAKLQDYYLAHEYLEAENEAIHFHEFVDRIHGHELEYLAEVELSAMLPNFLPADTIGVIGKLAKDFTEYEQYLDFLRARTFRQSLLVHASAKVNRQVDAERIAPLSVFPTFNSSVDLSTIQPDLVPVTFTTMAGAEIKTNDPTFKSVVRFIGEAFPMTVKIEDVVAGVPRFDPSMRESDRRAATLMRILEGFGGGVLRVVKDPPLVEHGVLDERPKASVAARTEAGFGTFVTIKGHMASAMDPLHLKVIALLDGTHTKQDLVHALFESHQRGEYQFNDGTSAKSPAIIESRLGELVDMVLRDVRNSGLLRR